MNARQTPRSDPTSRTRLRLAGAALMLSIAVTPPMAAAADSEASDAGRAIGEAVVHVVDSAKTIGLTVGRNAAEIGKAIGHAAANAGRTIGRTAAEGGRALGRAVRGDDEAARF